MAKIAKTLNAGQVMGTMTLRITGIRALRWRLMFGCPLIRLGAWIAGVKGFEIS